jgi:hypothetical protein
MVSFIINNSATIKRGTPYVVETREDGPQARIGYCVIVETTDGRHWQHEETSLPRDDAERLALRVNATDLIDTGRWNELESEA